MTNEVESRSAPRYPASVVPSITGVRFSPHGADATLLNISTRGVLVDCSSRFRLGTAVTVVFEGTFSPTSVQGRIARISVSGMSGNGVLRYHVGVAFNAPIAVSPIATGEPAVTAVASPRPPAEPALAAASASPVNRW